MRVSCLQERLSRGLGIVGRAVATRSTLPITNHVLIATDDSRLKLVATNLEIAVSCWIGTQIEEEGAIAVPAGLLTDFVNSLPSEKLEIISEPQTQTMEIRIAGSKAYEARISGQKPDDFPPIPRVGEGMSTKVDPRTLRKAVNQIVFAAAADDSRPVLTGGYAEFSGETLTLAAADGFRLAVFTMPLALPVSENVGVIVPARSLRELDRLLRDQEGPVEITVNPQRSQILFRMRDVEMVSQLVQGTFPDYKQLIPKNYSTRAVMNVTEFLRAIKSASVFARDGSGIVKSTIRPGEDGSSGRVEITARAEEIGENKVELGAAVEGQEAKIAFNSKYLMDVFGILEDQQVVLELTTASSPGVFRPVEGADWVQVVMPMFVQW
ncbi:MAG: DNA polymerase III subunit beta [Chloroflexi bacterium]|nr:DNA polymerase III subunit beta [Chloroflexota bacterium]